MLIKTLKNFFIPTMPEYSGETNFSHKKIAVLIPTFKPTLITYQLIEFIFKYYPQADIILIDDCTPEQEKDQQFYESIKNLQQKRPNLHFTKTLKRSLKAG